MTKRRFVFEYPQPSINLSHNSSIKSDRLNKQSEGSDVPSRKTRGLTVSRFVQYGTGIPMGFLSCFHAGLAFTHHCIIQACAKAANVALPFHGYAVKGDDSTIVNKKVAIIYKKVIV